METNLDKFYKTNKNLETEGIWFDIGEEISFKMKRFGGFNAASVKAASAKFYKPYATMIKNGTLPPEKEREVMVATFVSSSITDWKGVEIDGKEEVFDAKICTKLLLNLPDLADTLIEYASNFDNFKEELGNS